ncbi:biotin-dependent carboxyltransferase family protein [Dichotomicrobium thermohalophilum]|uniref:Allophanate hydrolase n=1 Tax=Dichotomicrobium thermohalophilum TaxID=933063 RepID=A0A397PID6_9HYPH|nr:biotin-dependent carboxyltransferase family protein [Dichotomicrobium thermohalophilum]RIA47649.1 allophanate hydrolase [Dichotomicrobium thermohalophilum]
MTASLRVVAPGMHTSIQDLGRTGFQHLGVPVSGALDTEALRLANLLVGNAHGEAALEIMHLGPTLEVCSESVRIALAGGSGTIEVEGQAQPVPGFHSVRLQRGDRFRVTASGESATAYLAVEGGFDIAEVLSSRSTYARGGFGGHFGRALDAGDVLPLRRCQVETRPERMLTQGGLPRPERVRVILGPQDDYFTHSAIDALRESTYRVSRATDRMGMRLEGPALSHRDQFNIVSDGIAPGAIQVPGDAQPIILLADRQTTGGYPKIATVISCDLPALGRLRPGDEIRFETVTLEAAAEARREAKKRFARLCKTLTHVNTEWTPDEYLLHSENIIGGVVHATEVD